MQEGHWSARLGSILSRIRSPAWRSRFFFTLWSGSSPVFRWADLDPRRYRLSSLPSVRVHQSLLSPHWLKARKNDWHSPIASPRSSFPLRSLPSRSPRPCHGVLAPCLPAGSMELNYTRLISPLLLSLRFFSLLLRPGFRAVLSSCCRT